MAEREHPHLRVERAPTGAVVVHLVDCPLLNEQTGPVVGEELLSLAEGWPGTRFLVDLGAVEFLTSTMLGLLVALHRKLRDGGGSLTVYEASPDVYEVFATAHLNQVFEVRPKR